jgi:polar amino acid transport system substrate-binding protein
LALNLPEPGVLRVGSALPDPPFELSGSAGPTGFDVDLMQAIAGELGLTWRLVRYDGADFNAIFGELANGTCDAIASGTTVTPARETVAAFCAPYLVSGQALACDRARTPAVHSVDDLEGLVIGVQDGNTSQPVAERLKAAGKVAAVRVYPYDAIGTMLDDLEAGAIGAVMKLAPVLHWLVRRRPGLAVVAEGITVERLAVAVAFGNEALRSAIDGAQAQLARRGDLGRLVQTWLTASAASASGPATTG